MITLQSTFEYADSDNLQIDSTDVLVDYPKFSLDNGLLTITGHGSVSFKQLLLDKKYLVGIPTSNIFGSEYGSFVTQYISSFTQKNKKIKTSDVSITFTVAGFGDLDALYFIKLLTPMKHPDEPRIVVPRFVVPRFVGTPPAVLPEVVASPPTAAVVVPPSSPPKLLTSIVELPDRKNEIVDRNIYAVNKPVYLRFLRQLFPTLLADNDAALLYMINLLVDLTGDTPALVQDSEVVRQSATNILKEFGIAQAKIDAAYIFVRQNFSQLFDFPIRIPKIEVLKLAGVFRVLPAENLSFDDFAFYHLVAEFSMDTLHVSHYEWNRANFKDNHIAFSFTEKYPQSNIKGMVTVKVMAFDNSDLYLQEYKPSDPVLRNLDISVDLKRPSTIQSGPDGTKEDKKLRGKVVSLAKERALNGTVVIQAKKMVDGSWSTVAAGTSDKAGNFTMLYPEGKYFSAKALVSLDPENETVIEVTNGYISSDFLYILLSGENDKDCACDESKTADRLPSQKDLVQSDQFTQDVGGTCVNLTVPNRTLKEYSYNALVRSSDPDVANYTLSSELDANGSKVFLLTNNGKVKRGLVDLDNPIKWQDVSEIQSDMSIYQAVTVATGHILQYKSEMRADGYSLGDLLYSVPLSPGQKKQIVIFDSAHTLVGAESQDVSQSESLANNLLNERSIMDQIAGNVGESLQGQSNASTSGISAGLGASGSMGMFGASLGVAGGYSNAKSSASQKGSRDISQYFSEMLRQNINQNASSYRRLTASAVTTVREGQQYNAETDVIANHNHCHSLTMMYFEVLRHFAVFQELVNVEECVFVPFLMTKFSTDNIYKWADVLAPRLIPIQSNVYLKPFSFFKGRPQHPLLPAFDAISRIKTKYSRVDFPDGAYDQDIIRFVEGEFVIKVELPRPKTKYDFILSLPITTRTVSHDETNARDVAKSAVTAVFTGGLSLFGGGGSHTVTEEVMARVKIFDKFMALDSNYENVPPAQCIRINSFEGFVTDANVEFKPQDLISIGPLDMTMWQAYAKLLKFTGADGVKKMLDYYFKGKLIAEWDTIFESTMAPAIFSSMANTLAIDALRIDLTVDSKYNGGERYMRITFNGTSSKKRVKIASLRIFSTSNVAKSLQNTPITFSLTSMRIAYSTQHFNGLLFSGTINGDILDGRTVETPESADEKRDPRKDDVYMAEKLIEHLNCNLEYYNRMLWQSLDTNRRWLLLDGFHIQIFDKRGVPEGFRSLSSVLKNNLVAIVGNSLVFPVAPGFRVSQSLIVKNDESPDSLLDHFRPSIPSPPYRISVPTRGVFMEAVMGSCDSCEKVKPDSSQDWTKFTTDEPTPISTVTPPVPTVTDWKAAFKDFASPMISIQNAPSAPDPGAGLAAVTELLGKSGIFKDVTGLDANQANAMKTYLSNNENVKALAQMASALAVQSHNTNNSSKIMDTMKAANQEGVLSKEEYSKLAKQHVQQQIDGGVSLKADIDKEKAANNPSLKKTFANALGSGVTNAQVTTTDGENYESMNVSDNGAQVQNVSNIVDVASWMDLIKYSPPQSVIDDLKKKDITVQYIENAMGDVNIDLYAVEITQLPKINGQVATPESLYEYIRTNMTVPDKFADKNYSRFMPCDPEDGPKWASNNPLGAVIRIDIPPLPAIGIKIDLAFADNAAVVVSDYNTRYWRFSTLRTPFFPVGSHPVSGVREFGLKTLGSTNVFYTRGADRATQIIETLFNEVATFPGADKLWRSVQDRVAAFVNSNEGKATIREPYSKRYPWNAVKTLYNLGGSIRI